MTGYPRVELDTDSCVLRVLTACLTLIAMLVACTPAPAVAGVIGGPADGMCPAVTEHGPCVNNTYDPPGVAPYTSPRIATTTDQPGGPGSVSAARWICKRVGYSHNDFLVWPGKDDPTHKHVHWGVDYRGSAVKTADELALMPTTCQGGTGFDTSAMWAPVVVDTSTMTIVAEEQFMKYYKSGYNGILPHQLRTIPNGFTMITGSASNTEKKGPVQHKCDGVDPATGRPSRARRFRIALWARGCSRRSRSPSVSLSMPRATRCSTARTTRTMCPSRSSGPTCRRANSVTGSGAPRRTRTRSPRCASSSPTRRSPSRIR
jgi:hypothetical protein